MTETYTNNQNKIFDILGDGINKYYTEEAEKIWEKHKQKFIEDLDSQKNENIAKLVEEIRKHTSISMVGDRIVIQVNI